MNNRCVCCGVVIPEGYQVCWACKRKADKMARDPYWDRISAVSKRQRAKGLKTYGSGIECNQADIEARIDMLEEELVDVLYYLEWLRDGIRGLNHG